MHTYYENGTWKNRIEGGVRASNVVRRRTDAVLAGRSMARKRRVDHLIHAPDGPVESAKTFRIVARSG
ncbi:DUF2188 domain-containing protein [Amycolatopsis sp. WQ 127309]|uniref:DUF2188 domain-containing protein n=1 Tax=Amycolatopsis sp. WQ 127309 TaxID=2932773 RepID=UPI00353036BC